MFLLLLGSLALSAEAQDITTDVVWQDTVEVDSRIVVEGDGKLTIEPGTVVRFSTDPQNRGELIVKGQLQAEGKPDKIIVFTAREEKAGLFRKLWRKVSPPGKKRWGGIVFAKGATASFITFASISKAKTGLLLTNSQVTISHTTIQDNEIGIKAEQRAKGIITDCLIKDNIEGIICQQEANPKIENNTFENNRKTALRCLQAAPASIKNNRFTNNGLGVTCRYPGANPSLELNEFSKHREAAVLISQNAAPQVINNRFNDNRQGIKVEKNSHPVIKANHFTDNATALVLNQGANASVTYNSFKGSTKQALFINNSSYPIINHNNFSHNALDIALGEHQSAAYEMVLRSGREKRAGKVDNRKNRAPRRYANAASEKNEALAGFVDARRNYWGDKQTTVKQQKTNANLSNIIDFYDVPYRQYGEKEYLQDKVEVLPVAAGEINITEVTNQP